MKTTIGKVGNLTVKIIDAYPEEEYGWVDFNFILGENTILRSHAEINKYMKPIHQIRDILDYFFRCTYSEKLKKIVDYNTIMALHCISSDGYNIEYDVVFHGTVAY